MISFQKMRSLPSYFSTMANVLCFNQSHYKVWPGYLEKVRPQLKYLIGFVVDAVTADFGVEFEQEPTSHDAAVLADVIWKK